MKKVLCFCSALIILASSSSTALAVEKEYVDPNQVISICEDVVIPQNVIMATNSYAIVASTAVSVTYDPASGIEWNQGYRSVWGSCQAKQGSINLDSYSRARFETLILGSPYLDSGRVWSTNQGRSYAESGRELYDAWNSGVAHTYYGIDV